MSQIAGEFDNVSAWAKAADKNVFTAISKDGKFKFTHNKTEQAKALAVFQAVNKQLKTEPLDESSCNALREKCKNMLFEANRKNEQVTDTKKEYEKIEKYLDAVEVQNRIRKLNKNGSPILADAKAQFKDKFPFHIDLKNGEIITIKENGICTIHKGTEVQELSPEHSKILFDLIFTNLRSAIENISATIIKAANRKATPEDKEKVIFKDNVLQVTTDDGRIWHLYQGDKELEFFQVNEKGITKEIFFYMDSRAPGQLLRFDEDKILASLKTLKLDIKPFQGLYRFPGIF